MSFKNEFKREFNNIKKELEAAITNKWVVDYKGHEILVTNEMKSEELYIDNVLVAKKSRKSIFSQLMPYVTLKGSLKLEDGSTHQVFVKLGGYMSLNCIIKVDNEVILDSSIKLDFLPWENKPKILPYILDELEKNGRLTDDLPDDVLIYDENHPKLDAGLADHLVEKIQTPFFITKMVKLLTEQLEQPSEKTRKNIYEKVIYDHVATYGGDLIRAIKMQNLDEQKLKEEAVWFLETAAHREVIKFALVLLAATDCEEHKELIMKIGRHEEFTGYAMIALKKGTYQWNESVFELAKSLNGWGKIATVSILNPTSKEIKDWLIASGCENTVANEALAYTCAVKGDLDVALEEETISPEIFDGATKILISLLSKQSPENIEKYAYAQEVMMDYLRHANTMATTIEHFYTIVEIDMFLQDREEIWEERYNGEWRPHLRESVINRLAPFKEAYEWKEKASAVLAEKVDAKALAILNFFNEDTSSYLFKRLEADTTNIVVITEILKMDNQAAIDQLCTVVLDKYNFSNLSAEQLVAFQVILDFLDEHEGSGIELIYHALKHELEGVQFKALHILNSWNPKIWKATNLVATTEALMKSSSNKEIKNLAKQILNQ